MQGFFAKGSFRVAPRVVPPGLNGISPIMSLLAPPSRTAPATETAEIRSLLDRDGYRILMGVISPAAVCRFCKSGAAVSPSTRSCPHPGLCFGFCAEAKGMRWSCPQTSRRGGRCAATGENAKRRMRHTKIRETNHRTVVPADRGRASPDLSEEVPPFRYQAPPTRRARRTCPRGSRFPASVSARRRSGRRRSLRSHSASPQK